jgi:hypothetical protein
MLDGELKPSTNVYWWVGETEAKQIASEKVVYRT